MNNLPNNLYTAQQVRELDRIAIEEEGIAGLILMQRAGHVAFEYLKKSWPLSKRITVVCGLGNNAGDGYVVARLAQQQSYNVSVIQIGDVAKLKGDALQCYQDLISTGLSIKNISEHSFDNNDVIVDAIFGTGLDRDVTGDFAKIIEIINATNSPVLSIDIPSGLNADTGMPMGLAIQANRTISFIGLKQGLFTGQGRDYCGESEFDDLSIPDSVYKKIPKPNSYRINFDTLKSLIPKRIASSHKGSNGHVLVIGGNKGYAGAARMCAEASARTGAGLVSVATRGEHANTLNIGRPELMVHSVESYKELGRLIKNTSVIAIGPGLAQTEWSIELFARVIEAKQPQVMDADALNLLVKEPYKNNNRIITPHPGEAARLLNCSTQEVQANRFAAVQRLQEIYGGIVVLKGSGTLVMDTAGDISVCSDGNPGMATGGMGDVLTGVIAALVAQGFELDLAAKLGVCLHSAAADEAAVLGECGLLANDLMPYLRYLINS